MGTFTHLHVHTQYSILDGASAIDKLVKRAKELGMPAIAITDHGNMYGVKNFHEIATKAGIKPILGCECYVARRTRHDKADKVDASGNHLILLAKNEIGYHNLVRIISYSYTEGMYYRPRIDKELLERYSEGLVCCSACLAGEVQQSILSGNMERAEEAALWFKNIFGEDYYLELQLFKSKLPGIGEDVFRDQSIVNRALLEIGEKLGIKCIATNDVHFVAAQDAVAHDHLICLNTGKNLTDTDRLHYTGEEYLKSYEEMAEMFPDNLDLLENTQEIVNKIGSINLNHKPFMPDFPLPEDFELDIYRLRKSYKKLLESALNEIKSDEDKEILQNDLRLICNRIDQCDSVEGLNLLIEINKNIWNPIFDAENKLPIAKQFLYLEHITYQGAKKRYPDMDDKVKERIDFELSTIERMGFPGYFLIVWDFIRAAREMGVSVGPGRGSAAGSAVAYCLRITDIDPIAYHLLFERFLNPERISMPDIDIDFDEDGREKVMQYVVEKYGKSRVAHIVTFGKMGAKNAVRDVARVQQLPLPESDRLAKLIPEDPGITLQKVFDTVPEFKAELENPNPIVRNTLQYATTLEGSVRQTGVHACGIIIGKDDLENFVPISTAKDIALNIVQYDGHYVENIGLLKMDFLGLKTLSIIKDCLRNIKQSRNIDIDIDAIPLDDALTFELYSNGNTTGIFQFESPGMKKYLRSLKPNRFEDLIAMNALYRPGPLDFIPDFISRKKGETQIEYDMPGMEVYLEETYGITVYQEQVMLLSQLLAGFTKGQADRLRKAMGKKLKAELDKLKEDFINGAVANGHDKQKCEMVWGKWESFASYAFNKSHSTCYAYISYQTAYLKAHYPSEFMAAILSRNFSDIKKISFFMDECRQMGRVVNGPDVNHSRLDFSVDADETIRFGLSAIKGMGAASSEAIIREREENGPYKDLFDFIERIDLRVVGKKAIENLIDSGGFDSLSGFHRFLFKYVPTGSDASFFDKWVDYGIRYKEDKQNLANSLFGDSGEHEEMIQRPQLPDAYGVEWSNIEVLNREKELIGMFVSAHPLDDYKYLVDKYATSDIRMLQEPDLHRERNFAIAGVVDNVQVMTTKTGTNWCRLSVMGNEGSYEFAIFGNNFDKFRNYYFKNNQLFITGKITKRFENDVYKPQIQNIITLQELNEQVRGINILVHNRDVCPQFVSRLSQTLSRYKGGKTVSITICDVESKVKLTLLSNKYRIETNSLLIKDIESLGLRYALN